MKKIIACLLCLSFLGIFVSCGNNNAAELAKTVWGKSPAEAAKLFDVSLDGVEPEEQQMSRLRTVEYTIEQAEVDGKTCKLMLFFSGIDGSEIGLEKYICTFANQADAVSYTKTLEKDSEYRQFDAKNGFYGVEHISDEDAKWLSKNTLYRRGEQGMYVVVSGMEDMEKSDLSDITTPAGPEEPLIWFSYGAETKENVVVSSGLLGMLNNPSYRQAVETYRASLAQ